MSWAPSDMVLQAACLQQVQVLHLSTCRRILDLPRLGRWHGIPALASGGMGGLASQAPALNDLPSATSRNAS
jgi:hypothetical protein